MRYWMLTVPIRYRMTVLDDDTVISRAFDVLDFPSSNNPFPTGGELIGALAHPSDLIGTTQESFFFFPHNDDKEMEIKMDFPLYNIDFERMMTLVQS